MPDFLMVAKNMWNFLMVEILMSENLLNAVPSPMGSVSVASRPKCNQTDSSGVASWLKQG